VFAFATGMNFTLSTESTLLDSQLGAYCRNQTKVNKTKQKMVVTL